MQGGTCPIFDLPADHLVTDHIVKYLGVQGIFNLWSCSGHYSRVAERLLTRLDHLDLARLSERCSDAFWLAIKENCCRLKRIELHRFVVLSETFFEILNRNPLLEELDISYCSIAPGEGEIRALQNLKRLKMSNSQPTYNFLRVIAEGSGKLRSVDLSWITSLNTLTLAAFFERLPQLREINVTGTKTHGEKIKVVCGLIAKSCPDLEVLRVDILQCRIRSLHENHSLLEIVKLCHKLNHIIFHTKFIPSEQYKSRMREIIGSKIKISYTHGLILTTYSYDEHLALVEKLY